MPHKREHPKHMEAFLIHGEDVTPKWDYSHHVVPPMTASATYRIGSVERGARGFAQFGDYDARNEDPIYIYERVDEPTTGMLEDRLAGAHGGEMAIALSTGMAAISALVCTLTRAGDHIVSNDSVYGCTYSLFSNWMPKRSVTVTFAHLNGTALVSVVKPSTRIVFFETPINPTLDLIDIAAIAKEAAKINAGRKEEEKLLVVVDNTFASPVCQRPIELGADFVVESLTKYISGFGTDMGGVIVGPKKFFGDIMLYRKDFGAVLSGRHAWPFIVYGLPSLSVRMARAQGSALKLAEFLSKHPKVASVSHPGLAGFPQRELAQRQMRGYGGGFMPSSMLYFVVAGKPEEARRRGAALMDWLAAHALSYTLAVSLGHCKTLIEHPSSMSHSAISPADQVRAGISPGGVRVAVGLEEPAILIEEMGRALELI